MRNTTKLAGAAGISWAAINSVIGLGTGSPPKLDASGGDIADYLHDGRGVHLTALAVFAATIPLFLVFAGELRRRNGRETSLGGAMLQPALALFLTGTVLAYVPLTPFLLGDGLGADTTDGLLRYAYVLTFALSMFGNVGGAVLMASAGSMFSDRGRNASYAAGGIVGALAVGGLVNPDIAMIGGLGFFVVAVWSIAVGVGMVREAGIQPSAVLAAA